jgi:hypothetical protein
MSASERARAVERQHIVAVSRDDGKIEKVERADRHGLFRRCEPRLLRRSNLPCWEIASGEEHALATIFYPANETKY